MGSLVRNLLFGRQHRVEPSSNGYDPDESKPYLQYYGAQLTVRDRNSLREGQWIEDNIITFWEEYLEREELARYIHSNIVLLRPAIGVLLGRHGADPSAFQNLTNLRDASHIFIPVCDLEVQYGASTEMSGGGSHWSLLVISIADSRAFHYDSYNHFNEPFATTFCQRVEHILGKHISFHSLEGPRQVNNSDCGIHVCLNMKYLLSQLLQRTSNELVDMDITHLRQDANHARKEMLKLIEKLRQKHGKP